MKKIFSFLIVCLLSCMTMSVWAQGVPPGVLFSSADESAEYWYNISFNRYTAQKMYWLVDHNVSGALINQTLDAYGQKFQWKFVLVPGSTTKFYMVNKEYREYVAWMNPQGENFITDSYGKLVPPRLEDPITGECTVKNWNGDCRWYVDDSYVYYMDKNTKDYAAKFEFRKNSRGWGIIDTDITDTWNGQPKNALNDWSESKQIIAVWIHDDSGSIVNVERAGVPTITTSTNSISFGALKGFSSQSTFTVGGRLLEGNITVAVEGDNAFKATPTTLTLTGGTVTVTFSPTDVKAYAAQLRITSPGAEDKIVTLTGEVYQDSDLPKISDDPKDPKEYWYYIQFPRRAPMVMATSGSATNPMVTERNFKAGAEDPNQMWKICGDWNDGYYIVNKATKTELLYNTIDTTGVGGSKSIRDDFDSDRYFLPNSGQGSTFNFVRFGATGWQLYNRDANAFGHTKSDEQRYMNEWYSDIAGERIYHVHQWNKNDAGNEITFIPADKPSIIANPAVVGLLAPVGETKSITVNVIGLCTSGNITAALSGGDIGKFSLSTSTLPAEGGELTITFTSDREDIFYKTSLELSNGTIKTIVPVTGSYGGPMLSTSTQDIWHYIQFQRAADQGKVWQNNGSGNEISQSLCVAGNPKQQWKFTGTKDALVIQNRDGDLFFAYPKNDQGTTSGSAKTNAEEGDFIEVVYDLNGQGEWMFKLLIDGQDRTGVNDNNQSVVGTWYMNDVPGNSLNIIPVEAQTVVRPWITYTASSTNLAAQVGEKAIAKVTVTGTNLTGPITATISGGDGAADYWLSTSTLPAAGGELGITFRPMRAEGCKVSLTLSSTGVKTIVPFTVLGAPIFSTQGNDVWYYIQFERTAKDADKVWTSNGYDVTQEQKEDDFYMQQWKFVGDWKSEFVVENRDGGQIFYNKNENEDGTISAVGNATVEEKGDPIVLVQNGTKWELQLALNVGNVWGVLNDYGGADVGLWQLGDGGNYIKFIPVAGQYVSIKNPIVDTDDQLVAKKFYTVQGVEVRQPAATGLYIVKKIYASGKTKAVKELIVVK